MKSFAFSLFDVCKDTKKISSQKSALSWFLRFAWKRNFMYNSSKKLCLFHLNWCSKNLDKMALKLKIFEFYFFGTNLGIMCDKFMEERFQFSNFCFWQPTTCQTIVDGNHINGIIDLTDMKIRVRQLFLLYH